MPQPCSVIEHAAPQIALQARFLNHAWPRFIALFTAFCVVASFGIISTRDGVTTQTERVVGFTLLGVLLLLNLWLDIAIFRMSGALGDRRWARIVLAVICLHPGLSVTVFGIQLYKIGRNLRAVGARFTLRGVPPDRIETLQREWCQPCGYSRAGLGPSSPCPECGAPP